MLAAPKARPEVSDQFAAHLLWMATKNCCPAARICRSWAPPPCRRTVTDLKHKIDVNTLEHLAAKTLALNEVGYAISSTAAPVAFDPYRDNREPAASS